MKVGATDGRNGQFKREREEEEKPHLKKARETAERELKRERNPERCALCNKKVTLGLREANKCLCRYVFCSLHKLHSKHPCSFDWVAHGREKLKKCFKIRAQPSKPEVSRENTGY